MSDLPSADPTSDPGSPPPGSLPTVVAAAVLETTFRAQLPAFWDTNLWPSGAVTTWLAIAETQVNFNRWGQLATLGVCLLAAHYLIMESREGGPGSAKAPGSTGTGVLSSRSVGSVSATYDIQVAALNGVGDLNLTNYGIRFAALRRQMGAGPVQLGGCSLQGGEVVWP